MKARKDYTIIPARDAHLYAALSPSEEKWAQNYRRKMLSFHYADMLFTAALMLLIIPFFTALQYPNVEDLPVVLICISLYLLLMFLSGKRLFGRSLRQIQELKHCRFFSGKILIKHGSTDNADAGKGDVRFYRNHFTAEICDGKAVESVYCEQKLFHALEVGERILIIRYTDGTLCAVRKHRIS